MERNRYVVSVFNDKAGKYVRNDINEIIRKGNEVLDELVNKGRYDAEVVIYEYEWNGNEYDFVGGTCASVEERIATQKRFYNDHGEVDFA